LVEGDRGAEHGIEDVRVVVKLLVHHKAKNSHLGSTAVVQFDRLLRCLLLGIPAGLNHLRSANALDLDLPSGKANLQEADEKEELEETSGRECVKHSQTSFHGGEWDAVGNITGESISLSGHNMAKDSEHCNAAVLGLHSAKLIESSLICEYRC
jgi:hypothetical protein